MQETEFLVQTVLQKWLLAVDSAANTGTSAPTYSTSSLNSQSVLPQREIISKEPQSLYSLYQECRSSHLNSPHWSSGFTLGPMSVQTGITPAASPNFCRSEGQEWKVGVLESRVEGGVEGRGSSI
eukprot:2641065-Rhodomonas_salina.3